MAPTIEVSPSSTAPREMIRFQHVRKRFWKGTRPVDALGDATFSVPQGEFLAIVGPSGCGKSTLLNMTAGLMRPTSGQVFYDGRAVSAVQTSLGYVTQKDNLFPWRTTRDNIAFALETRGVGAKEREERVARYLQLVGLKGFEHHYPEELSGGMRKRASLARTLIYEPDTLLMDEPFGALDAQLKLILQDELLRLWEGSNRTVVFVTHDLSEAIALADRVVVFSSRPGIVKRIQDINLPRPRDIFRIRFTPRFGELYEILWNDLREDIRKGEDV